MQTKDAVPPWKAPSFERAQKLKLQMFLATNKQS